MVGPMPYPALNSAFDPLQPKGLQAYWKADFLAELSDGAIDAHIELRKQGAQRANRRAHLPH